MKDDDRNDDIKEIALYLKRTQGNNQLYFRYFIFCETLNFFNVIFQMYLVDAFLGGSFTTYGFDVIRYSEMEQDQRHDPMIRIFPRMTKCTFHRYGSSGDVQRHDSLCILPLNIINEKIYIFMWFWFVFLGILSGAMLIYRAFTILNDNFRYKIISKRARFADRKHLSEVIDGCDCNDWFLLYMVCKNLDPLHFKHLIEEIAKKKRGDDKKISSPNKNNLPDIKPGDLIDSDDESKKLIAAQNAYEMPPQKE